MYRVFHIAVSLSLVVAITLQPTFAYALGQDCSADGVSQSSCGGCSCCKLRSEGESCPCCAETSSDELSDGASSNGASSNGASSNDAPSNSGCCGESRSQQEQDSVEVDSNAGMAMHNGPLLAEAEHGGERAAAGVRPSIRAADRAIRSACNCIASSKPLVAPLPRSTPTELREVLCVSLEFFGVDDSAEQPTLRSSMDAAHSWVAPHFSQISFCVWRL